MKILAVHNYYKIRGGEDQSFEDEVELLRAHGHEVQSYVRHNDELNDLSLRQLVPKSIWNRQTYRDLTAQLDRFSPDVVHCTNTLALISPSVYSAARHRGVPVVQALRNYRFLCANGYLLRNNEVCHRCLKHRTKWPALVHGCYRGNRLATATLLASQYLTSRRSIALYYAPSAFSRELFVEHGIPSERIVVKYNSVADFGMGAGGDAVLFVGRLSPEKGIDVLLDAWSNGRVRRPLQIIGDGPLSPKVSAAAQQNGSIHYLGRLSHVDVLRHLDNARCLIVPSIWYETFGRTIIEAFSRGVPVLASNQGAMRELIRHQQNGLLFRPNEAGDILAAVEAIYASEPIWESMRQEARRSFEASFRHETNYSALMSIYRSAIDSSTCANFTERSL